jgi:hypothetical protein
MGRVDDISLFTGWHHKTGSIISLSQIYGGENQKMRGKIR